MDSRSWYIPIEIVSRGGQPLDENRVLDCIDHIEMGGTVSAITVRQLEDGSYTVIDGNVRLEAFVRLERSFISARLEGAAPIIGTNLGVEARRDNDATRDLRFRCQEAIGAGKAFGHQKIILPDDMHVPSAA